MRQVVRNYGCRIAQRGFRVVSGGTDNHLMLVDVFSKGINGRQAEQALDLAGITVSRSTLPFDTNPPLRPSGVRIGTPSLRIRSPRRPRKTKTRPECRFCFSTVCAIALRPMKPRRRSVTPAAIQICVPAGSAIIGSDLPLPLARNPHWLLQAGRAHVPNRFQSCLLSMRLALRSASWSGRSCSWRSRPLLEQALSPIRPGQNSIPDIVFASGTLDSY